VNYYEFCKAENTHTHEITHTLGGVWIFCTWVPKRSFLLTNRPLPGLDKAGSSASGVFPLAARSPAVKGRSSTTRRRGKARWARWGSYDRREIQPTARRSGGRGGATPFPMNGRRTRRSNARTSITGTREDDFHTWLGRRGGETGCRR
jgi:hypothetical protein